MNLRLTIAACLLIAFGSINPTLTLAQSEKSAKSEPVDTLTRAKEISAASGRPIFAVAGRST